MYASRLKEEKSKEQSQGGPAISLKRVSKSYETSSGAFPVLREINLEVQKGQFIAILGKSGSGKSTLLNMITGIDIPSSGEITIASTAIHLLDQEKLSKWRGKNIGVVFQFFQLLPTLTIAENVMLPMDFSKSLTARFRKERAMALLEKVGIPEQAGKIPSELSGGQQQLAAIARALANDPPILVADEPTGNLDSQTSKKVMQIFSSLAAECKTIVMVTHEYEYGSCFTRSITLSDGMILDGQPAYDMGEEKC